MIPHIYILFEFISIPYENQHQTLNIKKIDRGQIKFREYSITLLQPSQARCQCSRHNQKNVIGPNLFVSFMGGGLGARMGGGGTAAAGAGETGVRSEEYIQTETERNLIFTSIVIGKVIYRYPSVRLFCRRCKILVTDVNYQLLTDIAFFKNKDKICEYGRKKENIQSLSSIIVLWFPILSNLPAAYSRNCFKFNKI